MNTKFIGIKEFRQNISNYVKKARKKDVRYVVMNRNTPLFEIAPFAKDIYLDDFVESIMQAKKDVAQGRVVSQEEILKKYALD